MRSSRRAAIADGFKVLEKYEYNYILTKDLIGYEVEEKSGSSYTTTDIYAFGECEVVLKKGKYWDHYEYELSDERRFFLNDHENSYTGRVVYQENGDVGSVVRCKLTSNWTFETIELPSGTVTITLGRVEPTVRTIVNKYENERWEWWVEDFVGLVRTKEGKYPDAGRGYTFVKTDGDYTIMTDGEKHYAYKLRG